MAYLVLDHWFCLELKVLAFNHLISWSTLVELLRKVLLAGESWLSVLSIPGEAILDLCLDLDVY